MGREDVAARGNWKRPNYRVRSNYVWKQTSARVGVALPFSFNQLWQYQHSLHNIAISAKRTPNAAVCFHTMVILVDWGDVNFPGPGARGKHGPIK